MSKSIYDEALNETEKCGENDVFCDKELIQKVIEQAKKQEKLLELYRKFFELLEINKITESTDNYRTEFETLSKRHKINKTTEFFSRDVDVIDVFNKIKELENDNRTTSKT